MKGLINIQIKQKECFRGCLVRYINPVKKTQQKSEIFDKEFLKQLNFKGVKLPVLFYVKIEKQDNILINIFDHENEAQRRIRS